MCQQFESTLTGHGSAQTIAQYTGGNFTAGMIAPRDTFDATEDPTFLSVFVRSVEFSSS
jgi:hypothetical protein